MVRTKQSSRAKANANGTPKVKAPPKPPDTIKSPQQPPELSEADKTKIKQWLDKQDRPFSIAIQPSSRKRKRTSGTMQTQTDLFDDRLNIQYEVKPRDKWECLRRYKKFTVGSESIAVGQCILVKHDDSEDAKIDIPAQWKAKVLEVRALDSEHVYIRLAWLNRPEDLDSGRKAYHGKNELIPTNQLDIIDAMSVNGSVEIIHWDERDDDSALMAEDQFFWRQTYDYANTRTFSELRKICVDDAPQNPDEMILQCGNKECRRWQHVKCIAEAAVEAAAGEVAESKAKHRPKDHITTTNPSALAKAEKNSYVAELYIQDLPAGDTHVPAEKTQIILTGPEGVKQTQNVSCLFCSKEIE